MATAHTIQITPDNTGLWQISQDESAAKKATELLQEDLEVGASAEHLKRGYAENASYQRPVLRTHQNVIDELSDWETAKKRVGKEQYYPDFLAFFQSEIDRLGWEKTLYEYMFKGDERSEDMLIRMLAGFLHPLIQLMYGVEWKQPAMVAMGLAQAAVHQDNLRGFLLEAEKASESVSAPMPSITSLLEEVGASEKIATSAHTNDGNKIRDGVLARAWDETIAITSRVRVKPEELDEKTAEMYHTAIYGGSLAAFHPGKEPKFDFFLIQDWIPIESKVRLLEWKIRMDLVQYAARACPPLLIENIASYVPKDKNLGPANEQLPRLFVLEDDGHAIKLFRAVGLGQKVCEKYEGKDWALIKGDLWTKISHLVVDSVESGGPRWVRGAGDPSAWKDVPDRPEGGDDGVSDKLQQVHL
ncbi:ubiquitin-specific protease ubp15 [Hypoxylon texense]